MTANEALQTVIQPPLSSLGHPFASLGAEVMLLAIGLQESRFATRKQDHGPAHGFWQFERSGVTRALKSDVRIVDAIVELGWAVDDNGTLDAEGLYAALLTPEGDHMACLLARALLWTYPQPLPLFDDVDEAWVQYVKTWGPGKPSKSRFRDAHALAVRTVRAA